MENTPMGCGSDLPRILGMSENYPKSRSVNNFLQRLDLDPNSTIFCVTSPKLHPINVFP